MRPRLLVALSVSIAAIAPYLSTLHNYFVGDDFGHVQLLADKPPLHFLTLFAKPWVEDIWGFRTDELRPFPALTYQIGTMFGGNQPLAHHAINIAIHALNSLGVTALGVVGGRMALWHAAFAGIVFAVLPVQVEAVSWIAGRSEILYTLFCISSLVAWARWRTTGRRHHYVFALVLLWAALFSKQNAVVLPLMVVLFDVLIQRLAWSDIRRNGVVYLPLFVLTVSFLVLRHAVFADALRTADITLNGIWLFFMFQGMYFVMLLSGTSVIVQDQLRVPLIGAGIVATLLIVGLSMLHLSHADLRAYARRLFYFGPVWWVITTTPTVVAGYATTRHLYFTFAGVALVLALTLDLFCRSVRGEVRKAGLVGATLFVVFSLFRLHAGVTDWNTAARISKKIIDEVEREALTAPPATLLLMDAPVVFLAPALPPGGAVGRPWIWGYAMPFAVKPPYMPSDLTERVFFVVPSRNYCCLPSQWAGEVTETVRRWWEQSDNHDLRVLQWEASTGALHLRSSTTTGTLVSQVRLLAEASGADAVNSQLGRIFGRVLPPLDER